MKAAELKGNPRNPRKISDAKLDMLKKSLAEFGDLSGIVFNRQTGHLVGGHQRTKVLSPESEITITDSYPEPTPKGTMAQGYIVIEGERYNYREVYWDETKEKAANIAANKHGGEWDIPSLNEWLLELDAANVDLDLTGFEQIELENLLAPTRCSSGPSEEDKKKDLTERVCPSCGEPLDG